MKRAAAVIFDLGGVVFDSPLVAMREFEAEMGLPDRALGRLIVAGGEDGAWAAYERGDLDAAAFYRAFEKEGAAAGVRFSAADLMRRVNGSVRARPLMLEAVERLRRAGFPVAALTNNWAGMGGIALVAARFDVVVQSWQLRLRKPDPEIYLHTCRLLKTEPQQTAFLDDLGVNLKPARALGLITIKVVDPEDALRDLEAVVGIPLLDAPTM